MFKKETALDSHVPGAKNTFSHHSGLAWEQISGGGLGVLGLGSGKGQRGHLSHLQ